MSERQTKRARARASRAISRIANGEPVSAQEMRLPEVARWLGFAVRRREVDGLPPLVATRVGPHFYTVTEPQDAREISVRPDAPAG